MAKSVKQPTKNDHHSHLQHALKELAKSYSLFSSIGEGLIVTNEYGRIEKVNQLCLDILGYKEEELIGKPFTKVIRAVNEDGSLIDPLDRAIARAFTYGSPVSEKSYYLAKNNSQVPVKINVSPILYNDTPTGAIEVFADLTEEYINEKIQTEFISIVSHQLRTPLSTISTYSQMLGKGYAGKLSASQLGFVETIENASTKMNEIIHALLNFTRIDAGNISVNVRAVDTDYLCSEIISSLEPLAREKDVSITYLNSNPVIIDTDPTLLQEILSNLISNGIKYTSNGGNIEFMVKIKEQRLAFSVKDDGFGIPDDAKEHVFSKFYRANNVVQRDVSGTGIGLYLAKQIAERLEGDIWFTSAVDEGTTFNFCLPLSGSLKKNGNFTLETPAVIRGEV